MFESQSVKISKFGFTMFVVFVCARIIFEDDPVLTVSITAVFATVWIVHSVKKSKQRKSIKKKYGFLESESDFSNMLIQLVAAVIKEDGKTADSELRFVEKSMIDYFSAEHVQVVMKRIRYVVANKNPPVEEICAYIRDAFNLNSKVQLMHLLIGVAAADGLLTKKEHKLLRDIALHIRLPYVTFKQILNMFRFRHEGEQKRQKRKSYSSAARLKSAYAILGITEDADERTIKKAYRKLAVKHHPDKVIHLGKEMQKAAKEKFQIISEAYELIKTKKGFS